MQVSLTHDPKLFNYSLTGQVLQEVMDAKYLGVTLSNNLEWSKHIATMTNKLKQTAYFSLIHPFMEYGMTFWDPYQKYNSDKVERVQRRAARFVKSRYTRYSSVSDILDELRWLPLSQRRQEARLIFCFTQFLTVWHKRPSKGTRRKHNMKFRQSILELV